MRKRILTLAMVTILTMAFIVGGCTKKNSLNEPVDVTEKDTTTSVENDTTSVEDETTSGNEAIEDETTAAVEDGTTEAEGEVSTEDVTTSEDVVTVPEDETTKKEPVESVTTVPTTKPTVAPTKPAVTNPTTVAPTTKPTQAPTQAPTAKPTVPPTGAPTAKPTTAPTTAAVVEGPTHVPTQPTTAPIKEPESHPIPSNWKKVQVYYESRECSLNYYTDGTWVFEYTGDPLNKLYRDSITDKNYSYLTVNYKNLFYGGRPVEKEVIFLVKYVGNEENLEIPKTIDGIDVLGLDMHFCVNSPAIKTLTIPETIVEGSISLEDTNITKVVVKGTKWRPGLTATGLNSEIGTVIYCEKEVYEYLMTRASTATCEAVFKSLDGNVTYRDGRNVLKEYPEYHNPTI